MNLAKKWDNYKKEKKELKRIYQSEYAKEKAKVDTDVEARKKADTIAKAKADARPLYEKICSFAKKTRKVAIAISDGATKIQEAQEAREPKSKKKKKKDPFDFDLGSGDL